MAGLETSFCVGKTWSWDSYFQHGETDTSIKIYNMPLSNAPVDPTTGLVNQNLSRFNLSQDAVYNAAGNIVCRNTVAQQYGCVPWNPFGSDPINAGAQAYFDNNRIDNWNHGPIGKREQLKIYDIPGTSPINTVIFEGESEVM